MVKLNIFFLISKMHDDFYHFYSHFHKIYLSKLYFHESYLMAKAGKNAVSLSGSEQEQLPSLVDSL